MDPFYLIALLVASLCFVVVPLLLIGVLYFFLRKHINKKIAASIGLFLFLILGYSIYTSFYPTESFYISNFEVNTQLELPPSNQYIAGIGNNSIYSFGDYSLSYKYKFSKIEYDQLYAQMTANGFNRSGAFGTSIEIDQFLSLDANLKVDKILIKEFGFKNYSALFMNDHQTVVFISVKW